MSFRNLILACTIILAPWSASAATLSVAELLEQKDAWEELAKKNESLRVEGRIASASAKLLKLKNCPLPFRPAEGSFNERDRTAARVEITGLLQRREGELVFVVTELREVPDDMQVYALKESALDASDPNDWYTLATWASNRGKFYEDSRLLAKATEAQRRGLSIERQAAMSDPDALLALATKAKGFGLSELDSELRHEALRVRFESLRRDLKSDLGPLIDAVRLQLPGAETPLAEWPNDVAARYAAEPLAVYNRADDALRPVLDRIFFAEAKLAEIERVADPNGANGDIIADRISVELPERQRLVDRYRERQIAFRLEHITSATRAEALALATRLEASDRADEATRALTKWLRARETASRADGPSGLVAVAEDYAAVLDDKASAVRLLLEALAANPDSKTIPDKLRQFGYVQVDGEWMTKAEADARPVEPIVQAMREGRVVINMSPEQVRKTLGAPDRVARAASTSQVYEAWIYGSRSGLVVHFLRYSAREEEQSRVVGVAKLVR